METRICSVVTAFQFIPTINVWKNLTSIIRIQSVREFKNSNRKTEKSTRYYISNLKNDASIFQTSVRSNWAVEDKLQWTLDVAFSEDASRKRNQNAAQNYSVLLKIALNLLKNEKSEKQGVRGKRLKAGWDNKYLLKLLKIKV
ncbi:MAG: ISAs1 family transposase [Flavobacteriales bacterium]|nr:ISAs1 family transposase [Flavobacteriales bacterium]